MNVYQFTVKLTDQDARYEEIIVVSKTIESAVKKMKDKDIIYISKFENEVILDLS
jgi:hypothetical protein